MTRRVDVEGLSRAVQRYFDLLYDSDTSQFERVFRPTAQLHGFRGGEMSMLTAEVFKDAITRQPSLKSRGVPREEQLLLMDFASATQALVKVRVKWNTAVYVDYLTYHRIAGEWLITAKGFHIEQADPPAGP
jgi:hypothetical protein